MENAQCSSQQPTGPRLSPEFYFEYAKLLSMVEAARRVHYVSKIKFEEEISKIEAGIYPDLGKGIADELR